MLEKCQKRITSIKEIAKLAGYSIATVSNTLNNKGRIRPEVRKKILDICQKHGYIPNSAGRNLRRQKNETIGLMFYPSSSAIFRNVYYAEIMEALEIELEQAGYDLSYRGTTIQSNTPHRHASYAREKLTASFSWVAFPGAVSRNSMSLAHP